MALLELGFKAKLTRLDFTWEAEKLTQGRKGLHNGFSDAVSSHGLCHLKEARPERAGFPGHKALRDVSGCQMCQGLLLLSFPSNKNSEVKDSWSLAHLVMGW